MEKRRVTQGVADEMKRLYLEEHKGAPEIAKIMGLGSTTVYRYLDKAGVARCPLREIGRGRAASMYKHPPKVEAEICRRYKAGEAMNKLAQDYGYAGASSIHDVLKRHRIPARKKGGTPVPVDDVRGEEILSRHQRGEVPGAIARKLDLTYYGVRRYLERRGIRPNKKQPSGSLTSDGYMLVKLESDSPLWPMARANGHVVEHRLVMARSLGRPLLRGETVHHIDGNRTNNTLGNLQLRRRQHGRGVAYRCANCGSTNIVPCELESGASQCSAGDLDIHMS